MSRHAYLQLIQEVAAFALISIAPVGLVMSAIGAIVFMALTVRRARPENSAVPTGSISLLIGFGLAGIGVYQADRIVDLLNYFNP